MPTAWPLVQYHAADRRIAPNGRIGRCQTDVVPDLPRGSICDVLPTAAALLSVNGAVDTLGVTARVGELRRVVVVLVDGMGWHLLPELAADAPLLASVLAGDAGRLDELACTFPPPHRPAWRRWPPGSHRAATGFSVSRSSCPRPTGCSTTSRGATTRRPVNGNPSQHGSNDCDGPVSVLVLCCPRRSSAAASPRRHTAVPNSWRRTTTTITPSSWSTSYGPSPDWSTHTPPHSTPRRTCSASAHPSGTPPGRTWMRCSPGWSRRCHRMPHC